ncbi:MAG TPA: serine/threonine-protein kinase, partial [Kofleriaceae bacterium]|nr:serine/threonine-protein kinase [Kofleriaceae bacterium]
MTTRRTPKWEETRAGVGDSRDSTVLADPSRDATVDARSIRRPSGLSSGHTIGRYTILSMIGRGGMGTVYAAHDPKLDRKVALKVLHDEHIADGAERLVREAQALARLADPHVVTIFDAGEIDGHVYLAMQLVDGHTLAEALERDPSIAQILAWFVEAGRGLMAAHAVGLVHRDFKPSNVLIDRAGKVAVTDFGLARDLVVPERGLTAVNTIVGTPAYMSPEQHAQQPITEASDQFSFCVALWESLFDQHPYLEAASRDSMSPFAIGYAIYDAPLIPPPKRTRVPKTVIDAITRGLSREPADRWPSMAALVEILVPPVKRRVWPIAVATTVLAAGAAGAGMWLYLTHRDNGGRSCSLEASDRIASTWSPTVAKKLADHFASTSKPYAASSAAAASAALDRYSTRWQASVADVCAAERATASDRSTRRAACLDTKLDAFRTVVAKLTVEDRVENVDRAQPIVDGLPDLADCIDPDAAAMPPADLAAKVAPLDTEIQTAINRGNGGDFEKARADLQDIVKRADALGWAPLQARAHLALGTQMMQMLVPARDELIKAAELATANHLDREAARAWQFAVRSAGFEKSADAVAALIAIARASAMRLHDAGLIYGADVMYGRALVRLRRYKDGADVCRAAMAASQNKVEGTTVVDQARDCLVEALVPLGAYTELEPLLAQVIAERTKKLG